MRRFFASYLLLAFVVPAFVVPAEAGLTLCNKTQRPARVALGRFDGTQWGSEGWWAIAPGKCEALIRTALDARYYYLYASDGGAGTWDGTFGFCVDGKDRFVISGRQTCASRGFARKGFYQVDTGRQTDVTRSLSD